MKKFLVVMSYLALASSLWATDFSLNPARDFGAIRRINPTDYDGKSVVREDGTGLSSDTAAAFRAALEVFSKAEVEPAGAIATHDALTAVHGVSEVADAADLSSHIASTGTSVHGLGTMATEASTDYVATDTFTGHTGDSSDPHGATLTQTTIISDSVDGVDVSAHVTDNSNVHGCTAIASASAVADVLSAANASDTLNLRLDGSRYMAANLRFSGNYGILQSTSDGSDNAVTWICGGGYPSFSRGANIQLQGNERPTYGGSLALQAGNNSSTGHIQFCTASGTERVRITYGGNLLIGTTTDDGAHVLQVAGSKAYFSHGIDFPAGSGVLSQDSGGTYRAILYVSGGVTTSVGSDALPTIIRSNGTLTHNGYKIWDSNSDGAGSGLDADTVPNATPASAGAAGTAGSIRYDASYIYICTAANTWKRVAIATW
jgi:hypothetical protein